MISNSMGPELTTRDHVTATVTIIGGGLAGLAAGCALAEAGQRVRVLERRPYVGGRASSYPHPGTGEVIDNCQHILLGCCTNLIDLYKRLGIKKQISWHPDFTYIEPGGRRSVLAPSWLPAPLHSTLSFLRMHAFSLADKLAIARGLSQFIGGIPADTGEDFAAWCARYKQTRRAIDRFWRPILASALNDDLDRISVPYAAKVIRDSFLKSPAAAFMGIPQLPLSELYGHAVDYIRARGGDVFLRTSVDAIDPLSGGWCVRAGDQAYASDAIVTALSFDGMQKLLPVLPQNDAAANLSAKLATFEHSPITSVHLWFDREITELSKAVLLDATFEWMYQVSKLQPARHTGNNSYLELIVSNSKALVQMQRQEIIDLALKELPVYFPRVKEAKLIKAAVVKEVRATFCVPPGHDAARPGAASPWPGVYLAGDWTATGWPATMEGAVRSGYLAAEACLKERGQDAGFLVDDLPPTGFMRLFSR